MEKQINNLVNSSIKDHQITDLLKVARDRLAYCEYIADYPGLFEIKNFDPGSNIDIFYRNIYNTCFDDSLLIIATLLDDKRDPRLISFWNWSDFISHYDNQVGLKEIIDLFQIHGLREIRDQIVGHMDISNKTNNYPYNRRTGMINSELVRRLKQLQEKLIKLLIQYKNDYAAYFDTKQAMQEIKEVMDRAKPKMTDNDVI